MLIKKLFDSWDAHIVIFLLFMIANARVGM